MERVKGIEPSSQAWEARILPLNHTRLRFASAHQARNKSDVFVFTRLPGGWQLVCPAAPDSLRRLKPVNGQAQRAFNQLLPLQ